ncbi:MAG: winged helix-turn-helix transcriptional regulator [Chitinispirillaceae bacterium]|nr:winged helix-turn-helix transcriptional regulator [Chitinispirillaceae bacterium]
MDASQKNRFKAQAQIMKALSHQTRLFMVHELAKGEKCVGELVTMVKADVSTVSKHLLIMKNAGIVESEKRGTSMYYSLKMRCVLNFFSCVNEVLKKKAESQMIFTN